MVLPRHFPAVGVVPPHPSWWPFGAGAMVACGNGHVVRVAPPDHEVAVDGTVSPSLVCPEEGCGWHETVRLDGWRQGA